MTVLSRNDVQATRLSSPCDTGNKFDALHVILRGECQRGVSGDSRTKDLHGPIRYVGCIGRCLSAPGIDSLQLRTSNTAILVSKYLRSSWKSETGGGHDSTPIGGRSARRFTHRRQRAAGFPSAPLILLDNTPIRSTAVRDGSSRRKCPIPPYRNQRLLYALQAGVAAGANRANTDHTCRASDRKGPSPPFNGLSSRASRLR